MAKRKGVVRHEHNPFIDNETHYTTRKKRVSVQANRAIVNNDTGEYENVVEVCKVVEVDNEQFVKLFTQNLKVFFDLKPTTYKILQVVLHQLQQVFNQDKIYLNVDIMKHYFTSIDEKPMSDASYYNCVKELLNKNFLAESSIPNQFFINPNLFFSGDRVKFVNEIRKKKKEKDERQMELLSKDE